MEIILFGLLTEITGAKKLQLTGITDTSALRAELSLRYPALEDACYLVAVDMTIVHENTAVCENSTIALMPPYSGG